MKVPEFQVFQCINRDCRMRFSSDLSVMKIDRCPKCGSEMAPMGFPYSNFTPPARFLKINPIDMVVVLDNLRSTLNVGSIFRTADGAGVAHVFCCGTTPTPEHPKMRKTSLGAEDFISWSYHTNAVDVVSGLKESERLIFALEVVQDSKSLFSTDLIKTDTPLALIVGNEISGIDPEVLSLADKILAIPMSGRKTSLNVAVTAGIAVYTLANLPLTRI